MSAVLKLVKDNNGEVQNLAIKWCGTQTLSRRLISRCVPFDPTSQPPSLAP